MPSERALEIAELAAPDACEDSLRIIANQIDEHAWNAVQDYKEQQKKKAKINAE